MLLENIILKPIITEKVSTSSEKDNRYGFVVDIRANKNQIRRAVEKLYEVKVLNVKTNIRPGKLKRVGRRTKKESKSKRAFVQLAAGMEIKMFGGV